MIIQNFVYALLSKAGPEGAVVSEFSTKSRDETDVWIDPRIKRIPVID